ncbi:SDR family oxidoreductase [Spectribacter hydrogenooxidans]|uniref:Dihydromonapterin reductase n=1 Tax=Spectribacter hydrogenoxidans TaxID=3075608 RepID=A0ABU3BZK1_9GAMM|nr:SDR family oxidoreductase [Salinisphaera sp. W335]MDT0634743.1 SDR family oxidoreductase [Salinisphaera sp. W335]
MSSDRLPVFITGAGRNVGAHIARRLLADGVPVIAHYRTPTDEVDALSTAGAVVIRGSLDDEASIRTVADAVMAHSPRLSGLIHNASRFEPTPNDTRSAAADFADYWAIHMLAPYLLTTLLTPALAPAGDRASDVVMITDIYADDPTPKHDVYCATKAGLQNLALSFAKRLGPGIKVNVIQPGPISFTNWHKPDDQQRILADTLLGRAGNPEAIYQAVRALMDNDYITGAILPVDGGRRLGR